MYLKYLPKRTHFGYDVMIHASMLAALDHNHNTDREQVGELSLFLSFVSLDIMHQSQCQKLRGQRQNNVHIQTEYHIIQSIQTLIYLF